MTTTLKLEIPVDVSGLPDLDRLNSSLDTTEEKSSKLGAVSTGVFQGIGQAVAGAGIGLAKAGLDMAIDKIGDSLDLASEKQQAAMKVNVLFGDSASKVSEASKTAADTTLLSSGAYLAAAGNLGNLYTNLGFTQGAAADMSVEMVQLAADMGSFNDAPTTEVLTAMEAAFRGEAEPISRFGVVLNDATLKAKAMELGLYDGVGALDANAKASATYQLILEKTTAAQGDVARSAGTFAIEQQRSAAKMDEAFTRIGEVLLPLAAQLMPMLADAVTAVVDVIMEVSTAVGDWVSDNQELVDQLVELGRLLWDTLVRAIQVTVDIIGELGYRIGGVIGLFIDLGGAIIDTGAAIIKVFQGDFEGAANSAQMALDRIGSFQENVQRAMGDASRMAADQSVEQAQRTADAASEAQAQMMAEVVPGWLQMGNAASEGARGITDSTAAGLQSGLPAVDSAAGDMASLIPENLQEGADTAKTIAAQTPGQIAAGLRSGRDDWRSALDQLKEDTKTSLAPAKEIAHLEAVLTGKAITKGLSSTDPIVKAQAQETVNQIQGRLDTLKGVGQTAGQTGAGAIPGGMASQDPAVTRAGAATTAIVTKQFDLMENGSRIAAQTANLTLATTLGQGTTAAQRAGENVASAWVSGLERTIRNSRDRIASAAAYATAPIHGSSPPKVGPLRHIDDWGEAIGSTWTESLASGLGRVTPGMGFAGAPPAGALASAAGGPVYQITVQAGVGDPVAIGREVVESIQAFERSGGRDWRTAA